MLFRSLPLFQSDFGKQIDFGVGDDWEREVVINRIYKSHLQDCL